MVGSIVVGICTGIMVMMVNEAYRRNLKKEIFEVKKMIINEKLEYRVEEMIYNAKWDLKNDHECLIEDNVGVYKKDKEIMEVLKREVPRINEEE